MTVHLVGAGPGDPGLLTPRGADLLARADVVVHDGPAVAALVDLARPDAELIATASAPDRADLTQDEINAVLVARGRAGLEVVRLTDGDPLASGHGGEEARALIAAGLPFEVVPGVSDRPDHRPLTGRTVVVTRARGQAGDLRARLAGLGATVVELPAIEVRPLPVAVPDLSGYAWLVLTSVNGVDGFFTRGLAAAGLDTRALAGLRVAAIGPGTAGALARHGIAVDLVPERFVAESLLAAFPDPRTAGERVLLARAEQARDVLPEGLAARGYAVEILPVYRTVTATPDPDALALVRSGTVDAVTFTSSSTVRGFRDLVGPLDPAPAVVTIGPVTSATAVELGLTVDREAVEHTIDGVVDALVALLGP